MDWAFINVCILSIVEIYGDFALRFYAQTNKVSWLAHGIVGYAGVVYFLIQSLRHGNVLYVNGLWDGMSGLFESIAAFAILGDRLEKRSQYLGAGMIVIGVYLLKNGI